MNFSIRLAEHPGLKAPLELDVRILISLWISGSKSMFESSDLVGNCFGIEFEFRGVISANSSCGESSDISAALWHGCLSHTWHASCGVVSLPVDG